jgi:hypothetical protein
MVLVLPIRSIRFLSLHARGFGQLRQDAGRQFRGGFLQRCLAGDLLGQIDRDRRLPADGQWPVPGMEDAPDPAARPVSLIWKRAGTIRDLDKRIDADGWPPDGDFVVSGVRLVGIRGQVAADVHGDGDVWPWYEIRYPGRRAACVVCGFGIVAHWDAGPAPRFLLARIMEYLAE